MINTKSILSFLCASSMVQGALLPRNYIPQSLSDSDANHEAITTSTDSVTDSTLNSNSPALSDSNSHSSANSKLLDLSSDYVIPTSLDKYVSQWDDLYSNFRFHSTMHQPIPHSPDTSGLNKDTETSTSTDAGASTGTFSGGGSIPNLEFDFQNPQSDTSNSELYQPRKSLNSKDILQEEYHLYYPLDQEKKSHTQHDSLKAPVTLENEAFDTTNNNKISEADALANSEDIDENNNNHASDNNDHSLAGSNMIVIKRDFIPSPFRKVKRSIETDINTSDASTTTNFDDFYNDNLDVDEYEFGYDTRDAAVPNFSALEDLEAQKQKRRELCAQLLAAKNNDNSNVNVMVKYSNNTLNDTLTSTSSSNGGSGSSNGNMGSGIGSNSSFPGNGSLTSEENNGAVGLDISSASSAMFGLTVAFAFASVLL